jgi:cbb3-type cytochrome oxidase maturation protein
MEILGLLIFISLIVIAIVIWLFFKMSSSGQFDDLEGASWRALDDVEPDADRPRNSRKD